MGDSADLTPAQGRPACAWLKILWQLGATNYFVMAGWTSKSMHLADVRDPSTSGCGELFQHVEDGLRFAPAAVTHATKNVTKQQKAFPAPCRLVTQVACILVRTAYEIRWKQPISRAAQAPVSVCICEVKPWPRQLSNNVAVSSCQHTSAGIQKCVRCT